MNPESNKKKWVISAVIFILLCFFLLWCFFGSVQVTVSGKGVLLDLDQIQTIQSQIDGTVANLSVKPGDLVKEKQLLLEIDNPILKFEYEFYKNLLRSAQSELANLKRQTPSVGTRPIATPKLPLKREESPPEESNPFPRFIRIPRQPPNSPIIIERPVIKREEPQVQATIPQTNVEIPKQPQEDFWSKEMFLKETELKAKEASILYSYTQIFAPSSGKVIGSFVYDGLVVSKGAPLISLQKSEFSSLPNNFYVYISSENAKEIHPGMEARVEFGASFKKNGYIFGKVKEISPSPQLDSVILKFNPSLMETSKDTTIVQVVVALEKNPKTGGYHWSLGNQPMGVDMSGSIGRAYFEVNRVQPIKAFFQIVFRQGL